MTGQGEAIQPLDASAEAAAAPPIDVKFDRADRNSFAATAAIALIGYLFTLAPNLTLEWSGIHSTAAYYCGVTSPPGYPVWTLYAGVFSHLIPFSNIAWRIAVSSAVASAVACGLVAMLVSYGGRFTISGLHEFARLHPEIQKQLRSACGCIAGLVLAFSGTVWKDAVVVDTDGVGLLLFASVLLLLARWFFEPTRKRFLFAAFVLYGLLLTNNQELIVALPGIVAGTMLAKKEVGRDLALFFLPLAVWATCFDQFGGVWISFPERINFITLTLFAVVVLAGLALVGITLRAGTEWRFVLGCAGCLLLGLAFYLYIPIASMTNPPANWGYARNPEGILHLITRGQYERIHSTPSLGTYCNQIVGLAIFTGKQLGWVPVVVALVPIAVVKWLTSAGRRWLAALAGIYLCVGVVLLAIMNPPADQNIFDVYFAEDAPYLVIAIFFGMGLMVITSKMTLSQEATLSTPSPKGVIDE